MTLMSLSRVRVRTGTSGLPLSKSDEKQKLKNRGVGRALSLQTRFQNHIAMLRNYQTILGLLQNSKREIEIQSVDLDYNGLTNLANEMRRPRLFHLR